jgi:hypothetical protein
MFPLWKSLFKLLILINDFIFIFLKSLYVNHFKINTRKHFHLKYFQSYLSTAFLTSLSLQSKKVNHAFNLASVITTKKKYFVILYKKQMVTGDVKRSLLIISSPESSQIAWLFYQ